MTHSKWVRVGSVRRFDHVEADKAQAFKLLKEASEVHGAWQRLEEELAFYDSLDWDPRREDEWLPVKEAKSKLIAECADVIQATLNLVAAMGVEDFRPYLKACEKRNRERGRITDGRTE